MMVELWKAWRGEEIAGKFQAAGMAGASAAVFSGRLPGHLPDAGGLLDQAAVMMEAFEWMRRCEAELKAEFGGS